MKSFWVQMILFKNVYFKVIISSYKNTPRRYQHNFYETYCRIKLMLLISNWLVIENEGGKWRFEEYPKWWNYLKGRFFFCDSSLPSVSSVLPGGAPVGEHYLLFYGTSKHKGLLCIAV